MRGKSDNEIYEFAQKEKATILTADVGFSNILHFPVGRHSGIVIAHFPNEISTPELNRRIIEALGKLSVADFMGSLIIIEPGKIRIRREQR